MWAPTLDELFAEAGRAMIGVMVDTSGGGGPQMELSVEAPDLTALLVDSLSAVLAEVDTSGPAAMCGVHVTEEPWRARMTLSAAPEAVQAGPAVKAVTYHRATVERTATGWEAVVYLDV